VNAKAILAEAYILTVWRGGSLVCFDIWNNVVYMMSANLKLRGQKTAKSKEILRGRTVPADNRPFFVNIRDIDYDRCNASYLVAKRARATAD